jgi:nucleosome binding factor SPN SPT16 subunit
VYLQEPPFFVMSMDGIEVAVFERIQFGLKHFDLTFVFKYVLSFLIEWQEQLAPIFEFIVFVCSDYTKKPVRIDSIPIESLDTIEEWLDSCDIKYYSSKGIYLLKLSTQDSLFN